MGNAISEALALGQSLWFDNLKRGLITSGDLKKLIDGGIRGVTSNPAIFEKAIGEGHDYEAQLTQLARAGVANATALYEQLAVKDIQDACDAFRGVYQATQGRDGFVSLEVSPLAAHDTAGT